MTIALAVALIVYLFGVLASAVLLCLSTQQTAVFEKVLGSTLWPVWLLYDLIRRLIAG